MLVLLTRPAAQSARTAERLRRLGHRAIVDPVLAIRPLPAPAMDLVGVGTVAVTSAHAAHALAAVPPGLPVYAVGAATARAAELALRRPVRVARGDGAALARSIAADQRPGQGAVLHLSGAEVSPSLAEGLTAAGFGYRSVPVYEARSTRGPSAASRAALAAGRVDAVLLYSPRSARLWLAKVAAAGLTHRLGGVAALCLSPAVADGLAGAPFGAVRVAAAPNEDELLRCLEAAP